MKTILVPTDFSQAADPAIEMAIFLARRTGAKLIFFHLAYFTETRVKFGSTYDQAYNEAMEMARAKLKEIVNGPRIKKEKIKFETLVKFGPSASDAILDAAKEKNVSLVVMGTHGASGLKKVFFGSNTAHVISSGKVPVLTIPPVKKFTEPNKIYYSTDLIKPSSELDTVKKFSQKTDLKLEVVFFDYGWARSKEEEKKLIKLKKQVAPFSIIKTKLEIPLHKTLQTFMKGRQGGILCLFHQRKSGIATFLFGSNSETLSLKPEFPLLVFPK